jgi:hypothetical protein
MRLDRSTRNFEWTIADGNPLGQALVLIGWTEAGDAQEGRPTPSGGQSAARKVSINSAPGHTGHVSLVKFSAKQNSTISDLPDHLLRNPLTHTPIATLT